MNTKSALHFNLLQAWVGSKFICIFWLQVTEKSLTPSRKGFRIKKFLSGNLQTNKSTINDVLMKNKTPKQMRRNNPINICWKLLCSINCYPNNVGSIKNNQTMN